MKNKSTKLTLSLVLAASTLLQPALADNPKYQFQYLKPGMQVINKESESGPLPPVMVDLLSSFSFPDVKDFTVSVNSFFFLQGSPAPDVTTQASCIGPLSLYKLNNGKYSMTAKGVGQGECTLTGTNSVITSTKKFSFNIRPSPTFTKWIFPANIYVNQPFYIEWDTLNASKVELQCSNAAVQNGTGLSGKATVTPLSAGQVSCTIRANDEYGGSNSMGQGTTAR